MNIRSIPSTCVAATVIVLVAAGLRMAAFSPYEIVYSDEYMQYLEQAQRMVTGHGLVPWEYRYGVRNALIPQILTLPEWLGHRLAPGTAAAMLLARGLFTVLVSAITLWAGWALGRATSAAHGLLALVAAAVWWESILFSSLLLSESLSAGLCLAGAALLIRPQTRAVHRGLAGLMLAGLVLGLAVLARLQYGLFAGVVVLGALWGRDRRAWGAVIGGGLAAMAIGALSDLAAGRMPYRWVETNLVMNMVAGRAADFGIQPATYYLAMIGVHWNIPAVFLLAGAFYAVAGDRGRPYRPLLAAALINLAAHSLIAHKEYRFVWVSVLALIVLAAIGLMSWADQRWGRRWPVIAAMGAALCLASGVAAQNSGGLGSMRGGSAITALVLRADRDPGVCGIAVVNRWRSFFVPAMLARDVPLSLVPDDVGDGKTPVPHDLAQGANALIVPGPIAAPSFTPAGCQPMPRGQACLMLRKGACRPPRGFGYQAVLTREDL